MVGWLVEQQQVWLLQQKFGERDAHLPSSGKFLGLPLPVVATETETSEHLADLGFEGIAVAGYEFVFQLLVAVGDVRVVLTLVVEFRHAAGERFHFFFHRMKLVKHRQALGKDGAAGHGEAVLGKVSAGNTFGARDRAVVERFAAGQNFHHRRLAGAVRSDQTDARFRRDQPVSVFE